MIVHSGRGIIVVPVVLVGVLLGAVLDDVFGHLAFYGIGLLVSAVILRNIGLHLDKDPGRVLLDPEKREKVVLKDSHTFFWIPVTYCAVIIALGSIGIVVAALMTAQ